MPHDATFHLGITFCQSTYTCTCLVFIFYVHAHRTIHADLIYGAGRLKIRLNLHLHPYFMYVSIEGSGESVFMRRFALAFHARIQNILSGGPNFDNVFFKPMLMRGGWNKVALKAGHHRPASETPFKWRFAGVLMMAQY